MMMFGEDMILSQQEIVDGYGYDNSISTGTINLIERFRRQKVDDIEMALTLSLLLLFPGKYYFLIPFGHLAILFKGPLEYEACWSGRS